MPRINKLQAYGKIINSGGKIFTATFTKKNGETRDMNCRLGVKKGVTGAGRKFDPTKKLLVGVYDVKKKGHRMINLETVTGLKTDKTTYEVE